MGPDAFGSTLISIPKWQLNTLQNQLGLITMHVTSQYGDNFGNRRFSYLIRNVCCLFIITLLFIHYYSPYVQMIILRYRDERWKGCAVRKKSKIILMEIIETEKTEEEAIVFYRSEKDPKFFTFPFVQFKLRSQVPVETIALVNSVWFGLRTS